MNIDKVKRFIEFIANKKQAGSNPTPSEINLAMERGFMAWVMKRYGNPKEYAVGAPIPRMAWQQTQKISDDLMFLLEMREFEVSPDGIIPIPDGTSVTDALNVVVPRYLHLSSLRVKYSEVNNRSGDVENKESDFDVLRDYEVGERLGSEVIPPKLSSPVAAFYGSYMEVWPKTPMRVVFTYLRQPLVPVWGYTLNTNGRPVYDPSTSVDIESPDVTHNDVVSEVLQFLGIHIRDQELQAYAYQANKEGI